MLTVKQRNKETSTQLFYRFTRRVKRAGIFRELFTRRRHNRIPNKNQRRGSAIALAAKREKEAKERKFGNFSR